MKQVVLIFPYNYSLSDFIQTHQLSDVQTNSEERSLLALLTYELIGIACTDYKAYVAKTIY
jgi:hypothetical protein